MAGTTIFDEDLVFLENSNGRKFGLVLECAENASSDEEDNEDDGWENVKKGTVRVAWHPGGKEEIVQEKKARTLLSCFKYNAIAMKLRRLYA